MFSLMTSNMEERLELIKNSMSKDIALKELEKCESLDDFYWYSNRVKSGIISQMGLYILENYNKVPVDIWNKSYFNIYPHTGGEKLRFGKTDEFVDIYHIKSFSDTAKEMWAEAIKIEQIGFVLDGHDGDFSVTFNNGPWAFLIGSEVLEYYSIVKNYLDNEKV